VLTGHYFALYKVSLLFFSLRQVRMLYVRSSNKKGNVNITILCL
jgi:SET domain-containing protein